MAAKVTFLQATAINSSATTYSNQNFGPASSDRHIVVVLACRVAATISSISIGGVAATIAIQQAQSSNRIGLAIAAVPNGTIADIVFTLSGGTLFRSLLAVYAVTGIDALTAYATASATTNAGAMSLTIPADGIGIAGCMSFSTSGGAFTWTNLTERSDQIVNSTTGLGTASDDFTTLQTARSISANNTGSGVQDTVAVCASWSPAIALAAYRRHHPLIGC